MRGRQLASRGGPTIIAHKLCAHVGIGRAVKSVFAPAGRGVTLARPIRPSPATELPRMDARFPRVVLVHDSLTGMRGREKCLERLCRRWPDAPLCTLLHAPGSVSPLIEERRIITSVLQRVPGRQRYYRYLL